MPNIVDPVFKFLSPALFRILYSIIFCELMFTTSTMFNEVKLDDVNQIKKRRRVALILRMVLIRETILRRDHPYSTKFSPSRTGHFRLRGVKKVEIHEIEY